MHKLIDYLCDELDTLEKKAEKGKLSMAEVEYGNTLAQFKKNLLKGDEMMGEGYSGENRMYPYSMDNYSRNRRRDSMGRYSSSMYPRYSMDNRDMVSELRNLMNEAPDDRTRQKFQRFISEMEQM